MIRLPKGFKNSPFQGHGFSGRAQLKRKRGRRVAYSQEVFISCYALSSRDFSAPARSNQRGAAKPAPLIHFFIHCYPLTQININVLPLLNLELIT